MISVLLSDSRLSAIVSSEGDMISFQTGETLVTARTDGDAVMFFPKRSSAHRQLLASLGIDE